MSLNGLVHPFRRKCESENWRWVYGDHIRGNYPGANQYYKPYIKQELPFRVWGYPTVTACSRLGPLVYADPGRGPLPPQECRYGTYN